MCNQYEKKQTKLYVMICMLVSNEYTKPFNNFPIYVDPVWHTKHRSNGQGTTSGTFSQSDLIANNKRSDRNPRRESKRNQKQKKRHNKNNKNENDYDA